MGSHWRLSKLTTRQAIEIIDTITDCDNPELFKMQIDFFNDIKRMLNHYEQTTKALQTALHVIRENSQPEFMEYLQLEIDTFNTAVEIISES